MLFFRKFFLFQEIGCFQVVSYFVSWVFMIPFTFWGRSHMMCQFRCCCSHCILITSVPQPFSFFRYTSGICIGSGTNSWTIAINFWWSSCKLIFRLSNTSISKGPILIVFNLYIYYCCVLNRLSHHNLVTEIQAGRGNMTVMGFQHYLISPI